MEREFLTTKEVAELLRISVHTIKVMLNDKTIPGYKIGGQWRFNKAEIMEWIKDGRTEKK
jgi:excisionase family DNA binding protein